MARRRVHTGAVPWQGKLLRQHRAELAAARNGITRMATFDPDSGSQPTPPPVDVPDTPAAPRRAGQSPPQSPSSSQPPPPSPPPPIPPQSPAAVSPPSVAAPPPLAAKEAANSTVVASRARSDSFWTRPDGVNQTRRSQLPVEDHDHDYAQQATAWQQESGEIVESAKQNAPAWLASSVLHVTIMLVLALWIWSDPAPPAMDLELISELPGEQLIDESVSLDIPDASDDEQALALSTLDPVDDPLSALPDLDNLLNAETLAPDITAPNIGNTFEGRQPGSKAAVLAGYGPSDGSENAVAFGLAWLAKQQRPDGSWSTVGPYPDGSRDGENTVAATAMAMLAFQGAGHTHKGQNSFRRNLRKAIYYLLEHQHGNGDFYTGEGAGRFGNDAHLYSHGQATIAICELYAMTGDDELKEPAQQAINFCVEAQDPDFGGWRYTPGRARDSDVSVTGWILMALQSGRIAGLEVPSQTLDRASLFLDMASVKQRPSRNMFPVGSRYSYMPGGGPNRPMTAEGLLCRQYLGWDRDDERMASGVEYLLDERNIPSWLQRNVYSWYYTTQTLHNYGGDEWQTWNDVMRDLLVDHQAKTGKNKGSWHPFKPDPDEYGSEGGRLYVTCLSLYILEVYYRHLPIYGSAAH